MSTSTAPTFVVADVHGHHDRLRALLLKAGIIAEDGSREEFPHTVVQLGDLGHYGPDSRTADSVTWHFAREWIDVVLWGNHDRAVVDDRHLFRDFAKPLDDTRHNMIHMRPRFAYAAHGYLLTHAGLAPGFTPVPEPLPAEGLARLLSVMSDEPVVTAIARHRGGLSPVGGILWRDFQEALAPIPQIFGHSSGMIRKDGASYCIDVGSKDNGSLAGIWLPSLQIVAVGPDADIHETPFVEEGR